MHNRQAASDWALHEVKEMDQFATGGPFPSFDSENLFI